MKIQTAIYRASAAEFEQCPVSWLPEFAFVGRSNVGKSSLINLLTEKEGLAKTSSVPGKTRLINFFEINQSWTLVDLPGYGFAKVSKSQQHSFNIHVSAYLTQRENLKHIFALIDSRIEPQDGDLDFIEWLHLCKRSFSLVFTKTDKTSDAKVGDHTAQFLDALANLSIKQPSVLSCSAKSGYGRGPILSHIESFLPKKSKNTSRPKLKLDWMRK